MVQAEFHLRRREFCESFHSDTAGWRKCELCGKATKPVSSPFLMAQQASDKMKNVHVKDRKQMTGPLPGQLGQSANMWNVAGAQSCLHQRLAFEFDRPSCAEKLMSGADPRARGQIFPRYCPRLTDQELQQFSGDSNSVITPLFEKMLSTSDVGRTGRLVLPKKCAEAHFPQISQSEGLPLKVQDSMGKEWVFQFRFWPNKNSRMYALEGVTPCIQSMQLQAGDTVIFSRMDPEEKILLGFRKASSTPSLAGQDAPMSTGIDTKNTSTELIPSLRAHPLMPKKGSTSRTSLGSHKRKSITPVSKSKEPVQLKLTWEAAQVLLRPPPNGPSSVVMIDGHEFEGYEEPPIIGMPTILTTNQTGDSCLWVQCEDCSKWRRQPADALLPSRWTCSDNTSDPERSSCLSAQELSLEELLSIKKGTANNWNANYFNHKSNWIFLFISSGANCRGASFNKKG